jgi:hypothetical protein
MLRFAIKKYHQKSLFALAKIPIILIIYASQVHEMPDISYCITGNIFFESLSVERTLFFLTI